jgi:hypothetical protein
MSGVKGRKKENPMKRARIPLLFLLGCSLLVPSCRKGGGEAGSGKAWTESVDGVAIVHNPAVPRHPEKTVRFEEEITFGGGEEGPGAVYKPGQYAIDGRNRIYIAEATDSTIRVFGEDGGFLRDIGRKGQGPGEFVQIGYLGFGLDGRLLVTDYQNRRSSLFGPEGDFLGSYQWTTYVSIPYLVLDGAYVVQESVREESGTKMFLKTYDFEGNELRSWGEFVMPEFKSITRAAAGGGALTFGISIPHAIRSVLAGDPTFQRIYHCLNDAYLIDIYDSEGRLFRRIDRPYERLPFTDADREEILRGGADSRQEVKDLYESLPWPSVKTVTERMFCDDRGFLWVATHEVRTEGERRLTAYDVFDADGIYDARVWLDAPPGKFSGGKMYRFVEDEETGIRILTRFRVVWE